MPLGLRVSLDEPEGPAGMADGVLGTAGVERRLGSLVQGVHGVIGEGAGHAGDPRVGYHANLTREGADLDSCKEFHSLLRPGFEGRSRS